MPHDEHPNRAGMLHDGGVAREPEMVLVRRDDWDAVRGDKCLLQDEVQRLREGIEEAMRWTDSSGECGQRLYNLLHGDA
jgi:hypothetical protein